MTAPGRGPYNARPEVDMGVNWADIVAIVLFVLVVLVEYARGFLAALIDAAGISLGFVICKALYGPAARALHVLKSQPANEAFFFGLFFAIVVAVVFVLSHLARNAIALDLDVFDQPLGALLGLWAGAYFVHGVMFAILLGAGGPSTPLGQAIATSPVAGEFLYFTKLKGLYMRLVRWSRQT